MKNRSYYSFSDDMSSPYTRCSIESASAPLIVNCAGQLTSALPFATDMPYGRLDYYLMYIKDGSLTVDMPSGKTRVTAGQVLIFEPRYHYSYSFDGGELAYYWCHFTGSDAAAFLSDLGFSPLPALLDIGRDVGVSERFEKLFAAFSEEAPFRGRVLASILEALLLSIAKICSKHKKNPLSRSVSFINEAYTKSISIPELAAMENLSNSRYNAVFSRIFGMPPIGYIKRLRMQNACELLISTDLSVKQIGVAVGYSDPHFFSKQFKLYTGMSPSEYRSRSESGLREH